MLVHSHDIHRTTQKTLKESFQSNHQISFWLHFHAHINIASFHLLISRHRSKQAKRADSEIFPQFILLIFNKFYIFIFCLHIAKVNIFRKCAKCLVLARKKSRPKKRDFSVFKVSQSRLDYFCRSALRPFEGSSGTAGSGASVYSIVQVEPLFSRSSMLWIFEAAFSFSMTWSRLSLKVGAFTSRMTPMATGK